MSSQTCMGRRRWHHSLRCLEQRLHKLYSLIIRSYCHCRLLQKKMDSGLNQLFQNKATEGLGNFSATVLITYQSLTTVTRENISGNTGNTFPKSHLIPGNLGSIKHTYEPKIINYQDIEHVKYFGFSNCPFWKAQPRSVFFYKPA